MKKPSAVVVLLVFLLIEAGNAHAYPIPPVPLWRLVEQADLVVVARVLRIELQERRSAEEIISDHFDRDIAVLQVLEAWKGNPEGEIRVSFSAGLICPAPPRYVPGEVVLAFLESGESSARRWRESMARDKEERLERAAKPFEERPEAEADVDADAKEEVDQPTPEEEAAYEASAQDSLRRYEEWAPGRWITVGLSYGTLYPNEEDLPTYRELVAQAARLQAAGEVAEEDRREWLISAAERRATRWQGLYELQPSGDKVHSFYDPESRRSTPPFTAAELDRLARGFVREPELDVTTTMMLKLLADYPDAEVDRAAVAAIEAGLLDPDAAWWLPGAMELVFQRFGDAQPGQRLGSEDLDVEGLPVCDLFDAGGLADIWRQARKDLRIPEVAAAKVPERRVGRVGAQTPD